ncbi:hypothetical protein BDV3_000103 [Batrachochytrium dendrobatidis]
MKSIVARQSILILLRPLHQTFPALSTDLIVLVCIAFFIFIQTNYPFGLVFYPVLSASFCLSFLHSLLARIGSISASKVLQQQTS